MVHVCHLYHEIRLPRYTRTQCFSVDNAKFMAVHLLSPFQLCQLDRGILHPRFKWWNLSKSCHCSVCLVILCDTYGTRRNVQFTAGDGSGMRVLVDVTDATRPILSVTKGADTGAMTIFKPYGVGKFIRDDATIHKKK